jgi:serine/threonine protein kinase
LLYNSPERIEAEADLENYVDKQDPWALGIIAYYLCKSKLPFNGNQAQIIRAI